VRKIVTRLTNDTLKEAGLKGRVPKVDLSTDVIAQRVARHFLGSSQVLAGRSRNA